MLRYQQFVKVTVCVCVCTGTEVVVVSASDDDVTWPNNAVTYVIESGSRDDFVINSVTGQITVSSTAQLSAAVSAGVGYHLTVAAVDGGCPSLRSICEVDINVVDVGSGRPVFQTSDSNALTLVTSVTQDAPVGHVIYQCVVVNAAGQHRLTFHWHNESQQARGYDVRGQLVPDHDYVTVSGYTLSNL